MVDAVDPLSLINISLVGLGLVVALYTVVSGRIEDLQRKKVETYQKLSETRDAIWDSLAKDKDNRQLKKEYDHIDEKINRITSGLEYHYDYGYLISVFLFGYCSILSFLIVLGFGSKFIGLDIIAPYLLLLGILNFIYVCIMTMRDMRVLSVEKFELLRNTKKSK